MHAQMVKNINDVAFYLCNSIYMIEVISFIIILCPQTAQLISRRRSRDRGPGGRGLCWR